MDRTTELSRTKERLDGEVAPLEQELEALALAREAAREVGVHPRGWRPGVALGCAVVFALVGFSAVAFVWGMAKVLSHD
jgi:hypothetical protein